MTIGVLTLDLFLSSCQSLKDKRRILNSLKTKLRNNFNISIAELDSQDKWQRAGLGIVSIGSDKQFVNSSLDRIVDFVEENKDISVSDYNLEFL